MKNKEKLRLFDEPLFCTIVKTQTRNNGRVSASDT